MPTDATTEYRVSWRREGERRRREIRQTRKGAEAKVAALLWSDGDAARSDEGIEYGGRNYYADMPRIVEGPTIEEREVGEWKAVE